MINQIYGKQISGTLGVHARVPVDDAAVTQTSRKRKSDLLEVLQPVPRDELATGPCYRIDADDQGRILSC